jgi:excisionase family DNA binding protein
MDNLVEHLKIPKLTLYKLVVDNKISRQKIRKCWRFYKDALDEWVIRDSGALIGEPGIETSEGRI